MDIVALMCTCKQGITYMGRTDLSVRYKSIMCPQQGCSYRFSERIFAATVFIVVNGSQRFPLIITLSMLLYKTGFMIILNGLGIQLFLPWSTTGHFFLFL